MIKKLWWILFLLVVYLSINIVAVIISFHSPNSLHIPSGVVEDKTIQKLVCQISLVCKVERKKEIFGDVITGFKLKMCDDPTSTGACFKEVQRCACLKGILSD